MARAPEVVPEMEARHYAACQVERIAAQIISGTAAHEGHLVQGHTESGVSAAYNTGLSVRAKYAIDQALELITQLKLRGYG